MHEVVEFQNNFPVESNIPDTECPPKINEECYILDPHDVWEFLDDESGFHLHSGDEG